MASLSRVFAAKDLRDRECVRAANKGFTERCFCALVQRETRVGRAGDGGWDGAEDFRGGRMARGASQMAL